MTYIALVSSKLAAYLQKTRPPTVALSIRHDEKQGSIELLKIDSFGWDSFDNKGLFWTGKVPQMKK